MVLMLKALSALIPFEKSRQAVSAVMMTVASGFAM